MNAPFAPNQVPIQEEEEKDKKSTYDFWTISASRILPIAIILIAGLLGYVLITKLPTVGSEFGWNILDWAKEGGVDPSNRRSFEKTLKLILTGGFLGVLLYVINKLKGGK